MGSCSLPTPARSNIVGKQAGDLGQNGPVRWLAATTGMRATKVKRVKTLTRCKNWLGHLEGDTRWLGRSMHGRSGIGYRSGIGESGYWAMRGSSGGIGAMPRSSPRLAARVGSESENKSCVFSNAGRFRHVTQSSHLRVAGQSPQYVDVRDDRWDSTEYRSWCQRRRFGWCAVAEVPSLVPVEWQVQFSWRWHGGLLCSGNPLRCRRNLGWR